MHRGPTKP